MGSIRACRDDDRGAIFEIVNAAAAAYRGVIPADRWHEPYMPMHELDGEIAELEHARGALAAMDERG